jgi:hypothetical protein
MQSLEIAGQILAGFYSASAEAVAPSVLGLERLCSLSGWMMAVEIGVRVDQMMEFLN